MMLMKCQNMLVLKITNLSVVIRMLWQEPHKLWCKILIILKNYIFIIYSYTMELYSSHYIFMSLLNVLFLLYIIYLRRYFLYFCSFCLVYFICVLKLVLRQQLEANFLCNVLSISLIFYLFFLFPLCLSMNLTKF